MIEPAIVNGTVGITSIGVFDNRRILIMSVARLGVIAKRTAK